MVANVSNDVLATVQNTGFTAGWDYKSQYVSSLLDDGLERFSQYSATPDSTLLFAGPARFSGLGGDTSTLVPIGLSDNISIQSDAALARLYEIGSGRSYFTRGKVTSAMTMTRLLADQANILYILSQNAYRPDLADIGEDDAFADGSVVAMNLDSEYLNVPFGLLAVIKSKGGGDTGYGTVISAIYCESCMFQNYSFSVVSTQPVISENVAIQFDRIVPVAITS